MIIPADLTVALLDAVIPQTGLPGQGTGQGLLTAKYQWLGEARSGYRYATGGWLRGVVVQNIISSQ